MLLITKTFPVMRNEDFYKTWPSMVLKSLLSTEYFMHSSIPFQVFHPSDYFFHSSISTTGIQNKQKRLIFFPVCQQFLQFLEMTEDYSSFMKGIVLYENYQKTSKCYQKSAKNVDVKMCDHKRALKMSSVCDGCMQAMSRFCKLNCSFPSPCTLPCPHPFPAK